MKAIGIVGSPRRNGNTEYLVKEALSIFCPLHGQLNEKGPVPSNPPLEDPSYTISLTALMIHSGLGMTAASRWKA